MPDKTLHINQRLTDIAIAYPVEEFAGNLLFPEMPVNKGSDEFTVFPKSNMIKNVDDTVSKRGRARTINLDYSTDEYFVKNRALKGEVVQEDIDNADDPLQPKADTTEAVTRAILLQREIRQQALAASLSVNTGTPSTKWDEDDSTPLNDIEDAANSMWMRPNAAVISRPVWDTLKFHTQLIAHFGGGDTRLKMITLEMFKALFELDFVRIGGARKNASKDPKAGSYSRIWSDGFHLAYVDNRRGNDVFTFGKTFAQKLKGGKTFQVREWEVPEIGVGGGMEIQVEHRSVEKIISEDAGYYISNTLAGV